METNPISAGEQPKSFSVEKMKTGFEASLEIIKDTELSTENIDTYGDDIVEKLITLTNSIVAEYKNINPGPQLEGKRLEDEAYAFFGLTKIGETLQRAVEIQEVLVSIDNFIEKKFPFIRKSIMPPDEYGQVVSEKGGQEKRDMLDRPRLKIILFILAQNKIDFDELETGQGEVSAGQRREKPYFRIEIPSLNRLIFVSDEYGNVTYIFDTKKIKELGFDPEELSDMTKEEKNEYIKEFDGIGVSLRYSSRYHLNVEISLTEGIRINKSVADVDYQSRVRKPLRHEQHTQAPEGWLTSSSLRREWNRSQETIDSKASEYRGSHPEWFSLYFIHSKDVEHYSPELIEQLKRDLHVGEEAKVGWGTAASFVEEWHRGSNVIKGEAEKYRENHPEWFIFMVNNYGVYLEHYSPELIEQLKRDLHVGEDLEDGWKTLGVLGPDIHTDSGTLQKILPKYTEKYPDDIREVYLNKKMVKALSPNLQNIITEDLKRHYGWATAPELTGSLGISAGTIKRIANNLAAKSDIRQIIGKGGVQDTYSPDLIKRLERHVDENYRPPKDWVDISDAVNQLKVSKIKILAHINKENFAESRIYTVGRARRIYLSPQKYKELEGRFLK